MQWCVDMWSKPSPSLERGVLCLSLAPVRPFGRFGTGSRRLAGEERDGKARAGRHQTHWQLGVRGRVDDDDDGARLLIIDENSNTFRSLNLPSTQLAHLCRHITPLAPLPRYQPSPQTWSAPPQSEA